MTLNQKFTKGSNYVWKSHLHERHCHWQFHCARTCRFDAISLCNPTHALRPPCWRSFSFCRSSDAQHFDHIFVCKFEQPSVFTTSFVFTLSRHYALALHYQVQLSCWFNPTIFFIHVLSTDACQCTRRLEHNPSAYGDNFTASIFSSFRLLQTS